MQYPLARARAEGASPPPSGRLRKSGTERYRQLIGTRKLAQMPQREMLEKQWSRAIQQRTAHPLAAAHHVDETSLLQRLENRTGANTANVLDLHSADRLTVRDYRERLQRSAGQPLRTRGQLRPLDCLGVFRTREYLPAIAHRDELHAVTLVVVALANFIQRRGDRGRRGFRIQLVERIGWNRTGACEQRGLQQSS